MLPILVVSIALQRVMSTDIGEVAKNLKKKDFISANDFLFMFFLQLSCINIQEPRLILYSGTFDVYKMQISITFKFGMYNSSRLGNKWIFCYTFCIYTDL